MLERLKAGRIEFAVGRLADPERMVGPQLRAVIQRAADCGRARAGIRSPSSAGLPAALLEGFSVVLPPFGTLIRQSAESLLSGVGRAAAVGVRRSAVGLDRAGRLTLENDAVWFVPQSAVEYELAHGMLVRLPLPFAGTG